MSTLYYFNPGCELEVVFGSPNYNLQKYPRILENDLQTLPMFFAKKGDAVLVNSPINDGFRHYFETWCGCDFITLDDLRKSKIVFDSFQPWGISPRVFNLAKNAKFTQEFLDSPVSSFHPDHKKLFSRESSVKFFEDFIKDFGDSNLYPEQSEIPIIAKNIDESLKFFNENMEGKHQGCVFKAPFGASGRGVRILKNKDMSDNILRWTDSILKSQGCLECEVLFDRVSDFSMHYSINKGVINFVGVSVFNTGENGSYKSSFVKKYSSIPCFPEFNVDTLMIQQKEILQKSVYSQIYSGPLGIDCMVYRDGVKLKVNPCVEINCRNSMGRLAMHLSEFVSPDSEAEFFVYQKKDSDKRFAHEPVFQNGKLFTGFLEITPKDTQIFSAGILATH